jgi:glycosyltransferase involved in cell wall biosynthesis
LIASNNFQPAYWAVLLGLLTHRPVVIWVHGPLAEVLQHSPVSAVKKGFMQGVYNLAQALVFSSRSTMDSFDRAMPGVREPLRRVIHNPAAQSEHEITSAPVDTQTVQLGFVGRLSSEKRPECLLQTLACLPHCYHLNIVGDGPLRAELEAQVQSAAPESRLRERLHFAGEQAVSSASYRAWQATLLCSAYEGYPMVALESLAAGVPCIATPLPALREMLGTDAPHWLAPEDTPRSLARTILASLQTPQGNRQALAHSIAARHPVQAFGEQWHALLSELLGQPPAQPSAKAPAQIVDTTSTADSPAALPASTRKTVHFVHGGSAYLPELAAYRTELTRRGHEVHVHSQPATVPDSAEVVWWICGRVSRSHSRRLARSQHVHEYASASVAPMAWLKDRIKEFTHPRPQHRVFQSEWLRQRMALTDTVPFSLRDMGVPAHFLTAQAQGEPEFDLVYLGEMSRLMQFVPALQAIDEAGLRLLLIGQIPPELQTVIAPLRHVHSIGRIPQDDVPAQLLRARAGLNLVPDVLPLSAQTSTKMLEYLAVGLPVVSNRSAWAEHMATEHPGRVRWLIALSSAQVWRQTVAQLPAPEAYRQHLRSLTWDARLQSLPLWQALGL